ncbi:MAG: hypothetical protein R2729_16940 [Bryobacteraceae bacterium]
MVVRLLAIGALASALSLQAAGKPEDELANVVRSFLAKDSGGDWAAVEKIAGLRWAALPPVSLANCMPDGTCFTRQGAGLLGGRKVMAIAGGARTIVARLFLRNMTAPFGEAAVLAAIAEAGVAGKLARCPVPGTPGGTNWYSLTGAAINPGVLSVQTSCAGKPCEGFVVSTGAELPALQPNQLRMYTEQCAGPVSARQPVSNKLPPELIAETIAALLPAVTGAALPAWDALAGGIDWMGAPQRMNLSFKGDPNPVARSGGVSLAQRKFSALASGDPKVAKVIYLEEMNSHPRGEHMLGVLYKLGYQVKLARCGPVYTESTNNWYAITSAKSHPAMLRQSIRYEGAMTQESYELRLDGTLPKRDPRDRDPGVAGCR